MTFIHKINKLFSKNKSNDVIGVSLQPDSLSYCYRPLNDSPVCQNIAKPKISAAFSVLANEVDGNGLCHIVLSAGQYQIVQVDKPNVPDAEINAALKWQVKDLVPFKPDNMVVDYFDGPQLSNNVAKINVVCADLAELSAIVEHVTQNKLDIALITTVEFAFAQLIPESEVATLLVCQHANEDLLILIVKQGKIFFQRRIRGLAQISHKTEEELLMGSVDMLSLEIQRSTDYFERQLKQAPIKEIQVIIPMDNEAFLVRKISENTNLPVNLLSMPEGFEKCRKFPCSVGASMLSNMEVNL
jgi:MSHA biogenesis protein MshI